MEQRTEEWFRARLGKATASKISDIIAKTKTGWGASRGNYAADLIAERLTGEPTAYFSNAAMQWGTDTEPMARAAYEQRELIGVEEVGFIDHPTIEMSGASPDGLVGDVGMVEIKCPLTKTHIQTLRGAKIAAKYNSQMQWQMACTGREWCDFASYDPRLPDDMALHIQRVGRDDEFIKTVEVDVVTFLDEVAAAVADLRSKYETKRAA